MSAALDRLARRESGLGSLERDRQALVELFVGVFGHRTYTGRSGSMYSYEGLGCVYWHMVSKLLVAIQEAVLRAHDAGEPAEVREALARAYFRVRGGLGFEKSALDYGAFPTDPYSHTPAHAGAQQPGMTGQAKEQILTRMSELGVRVRDGRVEFDPILLRREEFLAAPVTFRYVDVSGAPRSIPLPTGALAFTCCQVPVLYLLTRGDAWIRVTTDDGVTTERAGRCLDVAESRSLLGRRGGLVRIELGVPDRW